MANPNTRLSPWLRILSTIVERDSGCWEWTGPVNKHGYASTTVYLDGNRKRVFVHRFVYEQMRSPIPNGLVLDHLCRNTRCANPDHLEPVTQRVNLLRGDTIVAKNASKTHCVNGHEFTEVNTYRSPSEPEKRKCRACMSQRSRARWARIREAL